MEDKIRQTMKTIGWLEIRRLFEAEVIDSIKSIDTKGDIAVQYIGRLEAEKILTRVFQKLDKIAYENETPTISYK